MEHKNRVFKLLNSYQEIRDALTDDRVVFKLIFYILDSDSNITTDDKKEL